ncbi:hypothetical protein KAR91_57540 [Candidatus Pacearchaeota archaeon]|nr:hypothetical protein [Candidatus Pacearchaeota archaeon]
MSEKCEVCGGILGCAYCASNKQTGNKSALSEGLGGREFDRLSFLIKRDGLEKAKEFARRGVNAYRKTILSKKSLIHRREFIESYLAFKRFAA